MNNCSDDVLGYHNDEVTLPEPERSEMRTRRDTNRTSMKAGLKKAKKPSPIEFKSQGGYAMRTMTQHPAKDYDIDDGAYFEKATLVDSDGVALTPNATREMGRAALDDRPFKRAPEARLNCVRVYYDVGYHVDVPMYRRVVETDLLGRESAYYELATHDEWRRSDARNVTAWFEKENADKSPDDENGGQLRRMTRYLKKFGRSRSTWDDQILSGFGITVLVAECYQPDDSREDVALYRTMDAIRRRLDATLMIKHPVTPNATVTSGTDDPKARFLRDKLGEALSSLQPATEASCTHGDALKCWNKVFNTQYFSGRADADKAAREGSPATPNVLGAGLLKDLGAGSSARAAVRKDGGGRYA